MKILVTGANGFVGQAVCRRLLKEGWEVHAAVRHDAGLPAGVIAHRIGSLSQDTPWGPLLVGMDAIIHLAARVHVMRDKTADPLAEFRAVNTAATLHLARCAIGASVPHMVYMSSIKVNGEGGPHPYRADDPPHPEDPYGQSKAEAEAGLAELAAGSPFKVTVLRPPLVYGPGVGGNFRSLLHVVEKGLPLPLAAIDNRRSMIFVENLADAVAASLKMVPGSCETFPICDGEDVSVPELMRRLGEKLGRPAALWRIPLWLLQSLGWLTGKSKAVSRLTGSLQIDMEAFCLRTGWRPPFTLDQGLTATVEWFKRERARAKP